MDYITWRYLGTLLCDTGWPVLLLKRSLPYLRFVHTQSCLHTLNTEFWNLTLSRAQAFGREVHREEGLATVLCLARALDRGEDRVNMRDLEPSKPGIPLHFGKKRQLQENYPLKQIFGWTYSIPAINTDDLTWKGSSIKMGHQSSDWYSCKRRDKTCGHRQIRVSLDSKVTQGDPWNGKLCDGRGRH